MNMNEYLYRRKRIKRKRFHDTINIKHYGFVKDINNI